MSKILTHLMWLLCMVLLYCSSIVVANAEVIKTVYTQREPYSYLQNNKAAGFEIEVFSAVMKNLNVDVEFIERPWKRCISMLKNGGADALLSVMKTPSRKEFLYFPQEFISVSNIALFTKVDNNVKFNGSIKEFEDRTQSIIKGFGHNSYCSRSDCLKNHVPLDDVSVIKMLLKGRYDIGIGNEAILGFCARKMDVSDSIKFLRPLVSSEKLYVGFLKNKEHKILSNRFSKALVKFKKTKQYKNITNKYVDNFY